MAEALQSQFEAVVSSGDTAELERLIDNNQSPSDETVQALTREAASKSLVPTLELLLRKFPSIPLHEDTIRASIYTGCVDTFAALMEKDQTIATTQFDHRGTPLTVACMSQQPVEYLRFLLEAGADPNQDPDVAAFPIALVAAFYKNTEAIDLLLDYGAKLEHSGALSAAAQRGNERMLRHLLKLGAKPETDTTIVNGHSGGPLHNAARNNQLECLKILLEHGADVGELNSRGMTARDVAKEMANKGQDRSSIISTLDEHAAKISNE
jgi:ankyrin repeat protein